VAAEMSKLVYSMLSSTLTQQLASIYAEYGMHVSNNSYYFCYEPKVTDVIFKRLRHWQQEAGDDSVGEVGERVSIGGEEFSYPGSCGGVKVVGLRDLTVGFDSNYEDKKPRLPVSKSSHMITFSFANGATVTIRTSGTEPKIKWYSEIITEPRSSLSQEAVENQLKDLIKCMVREFYEPKKNKLSAREGENYE